MDLSGSQVPVPHHQRLIDLQTSWRILSLPLVEDNTFAFRTQHYSKTWTESSGVYADASTVPFPHLRRPRFFLAILGPQIPISFWMTWLRLSQGILYRLHWESCVRQAFMDTWKIQHVEHDAHVRPRRTCSEMFRKRFLVLGSIENWWYKSTIIQYWIIILSWSMNHCASHHVLMWMWDGHSHMCRVYVWWYVRSSNE